MSKFDSNPLQQVLPSSEILNLSAVELSLKQIQSSETQRLIAGMLEMARDTQGNKKRRTMVGLAAPQIGVSKRIIVVDVAADGSGATTPQFKVFINPVITSRSIELNPGREGCFSTGNVCGIVDRHQSVSIQATDPNGQPINKKYHGFAARILQHEVDHLNGIRFPDRITDDSKLHWVEPEQFGDYRINWKNWATLCPRQRWEEIRGNLHKI